MSSYLVSSGAADESDYLRADHPNWRAVERGLGALEEADAVLFASGQAASHALLVDLARTHGRMVVPDDGYHNAARWRAWSAEPWASRWSRSTCSTRPRSTRRSPVSPNLIADVDGALAAAVV